MTYDGFLGHLLPASLPPREQATLRSFLADAQDERLWDQLAPFEDWLKEQELWSLGYARRLVCAFPDSTALRLLAANAFHEDGGPGRAALVKAQCYLYAECKLHGRSDGGSSARLREVVSRHAANADNDLRMLFVDIPRPASATASRGFIDALSVDYDWWERYGASVVTYLPVLALYFRDVIQSRWSGVDGNSWSIHPAHPNDPQPTLAPWQTTLRYGPPAGFNGAYTLSDAMREFGRQAIRWARKNAEMPGVLLP